MDCDHALALLDQWQGQAVSVSIVASADTSTSSGATFQGELGRGSQEWTVISPRPGTRRLFSIGTTGTMMLAEGDFIGAEFEPALDALVLTLEDLQVNIARVADG